MSHQRSKDPHSEFAKWAIMFGLSWRDKIHWIVMKRDKNMSPSHMANPRHTRGLWLLCFLSCILKKIFSWENLKISYCYSVKYLWSGENTRHILMHTQKLLCLMKESLSNSAQLHGFGILFSGQFQYIYSPTQMFRKKRLKAHSGNMWELAPLCSTHEKLFHKHLHWKQAWPHVQHAHANQLLV